MDKLNNKSGFTLIEIIVVLIIVGVLAAIALPNLFSNVQRSQAAEAVSSLGAIKSTVEGCLMGHPGSESASCSGTSASFGKTANFTYSFGANLSGAASGGNYTLLGVSTSVAANTVTLTKNAATGALSCSGQGAYAGVC